MSGFKSWLCSWATDLAPVSSPFCVCCPYKVCLIVPASYTADRAKQIGVKCTESNTHMNMVDAVPEYDTGSNLFKPSGFTKGMFLSVSHEASHWPFFISLTLRGLLGGHCTALETDCSVTELLWATRELLTVWPWSATSAELGSLLLTGLGGPCFYISQMPAHTGIWVTHITTPRTGTFPA